MPISSEDLRNAEDKQAADRLEQSMVVLATVLMRKIGRKSLTVSLDEIRKAQAEGLAEVSAGKEPGSVRYKLPNKKKP